MSRNIDLVYGGGSIGLMGLVSQAVYDGGRHVIGWEMSIFFLVMMVLYMLDMLLICAILLSLYCCRVIPRTLMPREVILGCLDLKEMTKQVTIGKKIIKYNFLFLPQYVLILLFLFQFYVSSFWLISTLLLLSKYIDFPLSFFICVWFM